MNGPCESLQIKCIMWSYKRTLSPECKLASLCGQIKCKLPCVLKIPTSMVHYGIRGWDD